VVGGVMSVLLPLVAVVIAFGFAITWITTRSGGSTSPS
jgi:hypothetical protein